MTDSQLPCSAESARDVLRTFCKAGGELGCSCSDQNYQWFGLECRERMAGAYKRMLSSAPAQPAGLREALQAVAKGEYTDLPPLGDSRPVSQPSPAATVETLTPAEAWSELVEKDDRTSPEDYPEMALITEEELRDFMQRGAVKSKVLDPTDEFYYDGYEQARSDLTAHPRSSAATVDVLYAAIYKANGCTLNDGEAVCAAISNAIASVQPQQVKVTDAMVKAGAAAMCCQAQTLGCAAQQGSSEFSTCMLSTFMLDARSCLDAALSLTRPQSRSGE